MVEDYRTFLMPLFGLKNRSLNMYISDSKHLRFKKGNKEKKLFEILIKSCYVFIYWNAKLNNLKFKCDFNYFFFWGGYKYKNINSVMSALNKPYPPPPLPQKPPLIITWLRCYSYLTIYMEFHSSRPFLPSCWRRSSDPVFLSPPISTECQKWSILAHIFFYSMYFFDILPINLSVCIYAEWCDKNPHSFTMANILPFFHTIFAQYGYAAEDAYRI